MSEQFIDYRRKPSTERYDPAVEAAKQARADAAQARAMREAERLAAQRERLARADQLLGMLANIAADPRVDISERVKAAGQYLDRVLPRIKSVEVQADARVQVDDRRFVPAAERVAALPFNEALADAMRRLQQYDLQRATAQGDGPVLIEQRGDDDDEAR